MKLETSPIRSLVHAGILALLSAIGPGRLAAATYDWINTTSGTFSTGANWSPAGPPGVLDTARFAIPNTYNVTFSANATNTTFTMNQGSATFFLNGWTYQTTSTSTNGMGAANATASLRITNGSFSPGGFDVGGSSGSNATLTLENVNMTSGVGVFTVGLNGTGTLVVKSSSSLTTNGNARLGTNVGSVGTATVSGGGSGWTASNTLRVGINGNGALHVLDGGVVTANLLEVGESPGGFGLLNVGGANSVFTCTGNANLGGVSALAPGDAATLAVGPGGTVNLNWTTNLRTSAALQITGGTLNLGTVTIGDGAQSLWTGGKIHFANASSLTTAMIDFLLGGDHVLGANRTLEAALGTMTLGSALSVTGTLQVPDLTLDAPLEIGAFGTVGADTVTQNAGQTLQIADFGTLAATSLVLNNGGTIELQGPAATVSGFTANAFGTIQGTGVFAGGMNIGTGGTVRGRAGDHLVVVGPGLTSSGRIELSGGTVEYTHVLSNLGNAIISGRGEFRGGTSSPGGNGLSNLGQLQFSGGFTDIRGDVINASGGKITISGGGLLTLYDALTHNGADVKAAAGSALVCFGPVTGAGSFTGAGTVYFEGGYSPGASPAQVGIATQLVLGPANVLVLEIGGATAGSDYDQLDFGSLGELVAGGTLEVHLINGFIPQLGDAFQLMVVPKTTGSFDQILLPGLPAGLAWDASELTAQGWLTVVEDLTDTDADGLPDYWEIQCFGDLAQAGGGDNDQDGTDNLTEWLAGTDPTDPASRLRLRFVERGPSRATVGVSPYLFQRVYQLEFSDDLQAPWQVVPSPPQMVVGSELRLLDPNATVPRRFYRVEVQLAP